MPHFHIIAQLGAGELGRAYLASGADGALVVLKRASHDDVQREAAALTTLRHPSIVQLRGTETHPPTLVLEYLRGKTLATYLGAPLPHAVVAAIGAQLAAALAHVHDNGWLHRDVKPDNVFIEPDGRVVLADFGVAAAAGVRSDRNGEHVTGTPLYLSPEQVGAATPLDEASDVYALGVVLYQALTGHLPYAAVDFGTLMHAIAVDPPLPIADPTPLAALILRLLCKRAPERPRAHDVARALHEEDDVAALSAWARG